MYVDHKNNRVVTQLYGAYNQFVIISLKIKIKILTLLLLNTIINSSMAQDLIPYRDGNKVGYSDSLGQIIIKPSWEYARFFVEGRALVFNKDKYHFINKNGEILFKKGFIEAYNFKNLTALVKDEIGWCIIDTSGNIVSRLKGDDVRPFQGQYLNKQFDSLFVSITNSRYNLINIKGDFLTKSDYSYISYHISKENKKNLIRVSADLDSNNYNEAGAINIFGKCVINPIYNSIDLNFTDSLVKIELNDKFGLLNSSYKMIAPIIYDNIQKLDNQLFLIEKKRKSGLISNHGKIILEPKYLEIIYYSQSPNYLLVFEKNYKKPIWINRNGTIYQKK